MSVIIMILLISILILVHEFGHFFAARMFKIKVDKFGFGLPFGPTLFETKWGDTKVLVHAFLLGGYVAFPDDEKDCELDEKSEDRFLNRPVYQRAIVVSAGVIANILCAFVLVFLTASLWGNLPSGKYEIFVKNIIAPKNETVWQSGMEKNDLIYKINGAKINNVYSMLKFTQLSKTNDNRVNKTFVFDNYTKLKNLNPAFKENEIIPKGVLVKLPEHTFEPSVKLDEKVLKGLKVHKDSDAVLTNRQKEIRDELQGKSYYLSDGKSTLHDISYAVSDNSNPLNIQVKRGDKIIDLKPVIANEKGLIGIQLEPKEILIPTKNPIEVIKVGTKYLYDNTYMMLYGLYQIFTGQVKLTDLHGIVAITKVGGDIIRNSGIFSGLLLTAVISINLAIVNFLPIPALDGGHILFLILEKLRGKPVEEKVVERIGNAGFYLLILLMFFVIFNDIFALITKKF